MVYIKHLEFVNATTVMTLREDSEELEFCFRSQQRGCLDLPIAVCEQLPFTENTTQQNFWADIETAATLRNKHNHSREMDLSLVSDSVCQGSSRYDWAFGSSTIRDDGSVPETVEKGVQHSRVFGVFALLACSRSNSKLYKLRLWI